MFVFSDDMVNPLNPNYIYGWVEISADEDGTLKLVGSAIDIDGGPMIVGSGSATPEPSSALLLLVGGALLALRRRVPHEPRKFDILCAPERRRKNKR